MRRFFPFLLALTCLHSGTLARAASHSCNHPIPKECKTVITEIRRRPKPPNWANVASTATWPFRAFGTGIYYVVQGPRMLAELIAFRNIGENFSAKHEDLQGSAD